MEFIKVSFQGQHIYVGIDVHKRRWVVTIIISGMIVKTYSMDPNPEQLAQSLKRDYPGAIYHSVYEAGFCGFWIHRELIKAGIDNIVVNPADVPGTHKEKRRKDDRVDSKKLAKELSVNNLTGIYILSEQSEALRSLSRVRIQVVKDQVRIKNRITSLLDLSGIKTPENNEIKHWSARYLRFLSEIQFDYPEKTMTLNLLIQTLQQIRSQLVLVIKELKQFINQDKQAREIMSYLQSVPGVGFITAISLYTEIIDIRRFNKFEELVAFIGLAPDCDSSGESQKITGITVRRHNYLRSLLVEDAWIAVRKDPAMTKVFTQWAQRMGKQRAIIRVAKKLLSRIMYVWNNHKNYELSIAS